MMFSGNLKVAVIGGGSWATALVKILAENPATRVNWWLRDEADIEHIRLHHHNPSYLSDVHINPKRVTPYASLKAALKGAEYVVLAIPAAFVKEPFENLDPGLLKGKQVISAVKGLIPSDHVLITDWLSRDFGVPRSSLCAIGGPCHAEEVALGKQSYLTIASADIETAKRVSPLLSCRYVTTHPSDDLYGVEYSAVIKNIIALACGITHGLGYGDNFQAVLVSCAMEEIERFLTAVDPRPRNLSASAYLGDLLVTAYSQFSRNRLFGNMLGRGYSVAAAQLEMKMVAEGYYAAKSISVINERYSVSMPVTDMVYQIIYGNVSPVAAVEELKKLLR
jgi:glycerol-3-phosphate dehydrogenase (NAD(P)+)